MSNKVNFYTTAPEIMGQFREIGKLLENSGLASDLIAIVSLRASQINGCAFCLALHVREAQALGKSSDWIICLPAWRESPWYSARERAALEWTEALTLVGDEHPPKDLVSQMKEHFTERELVYLTLAVTTINTYNRFNVAFGTSPESADEVFKMLRPQLVPTI